MVQIETKLSAVDKLGIITGKCIHVYKGFYKKSTASIGDKILVSIRKCASNKVVSKKKKTNQAILVHVNVFCKRLSGSSYRFDKNSFLTLHTDGSYRGNSLPIAFSRELLFSSLKESGFLTVALF